MNLTVRTLCIALSLLPVSAAYAAAVSPADPAGTAIQPPPASARAPSEWMKRSDALIQPALDELSKTIPEMASMFGSDRHDTEVADFLPQNHERRLKVNEARLASLSLLRAAEKDPNVKLDLDIVIQALSRQNETARLQRQMLLEYSSASRLAFMGIKTLLDPRNTPARQARALKRLATYAGSAPGATPIASLMRARTEEDLARPGLTGPYGAEIQQELANTPRFLKGIAQLFKESKLTGWEDDFAKLSKQVADYDAWAKANVLPRARTEVRLPPALYADALKQMGVEIGPDQLIAQATFDFQEVRDQMQALAASIAAKRGLPSSDYRDVIRELKKTQLAPDQVMPVYRARLKEIEDIIRREDLVTLPGRQAKIRLATEAETAQTPAPHMNMPRIIGNTGEYGEFVLTQGNPNAKSKAVLDDFNFEANTWTLTAHEARPGHELQFASMVEQGTSLARATFAFNSANAEGWALYAESLMLPHMPPEGQLISLQHRMHRMARAFLDPMVNLGRMTPEEAKQFLMRELVFSEPWAQSEADRYAFNAPGQATSYYYGYVQLRGLRTLAEQKMGSKFNLKAFNDFVVSLGMLPAHLVRQMVMEQFVPTQLALAPAEKKVAAVPQAEKAPAQQ